ncbi:hypothetical protein CEXT_599591 [Caerostris extrusa]|uniref:Uncharacterized protein n=1 Tax=Caerostris extrusa TaxID=172846 RepID=A0AAV4XNY1_CAEEX|nr:hypothetical protein CEXT_599591 [Caerostris extrusa]
MQTELKSKQLPVFLCKQQHSVNMPVGTMHFIPLNRKFIFGKIQIFSFVKKKPIKMLLLPSFYKNLGPNLCCCCDFFFINFGHHSLCHWSSILFKTKFLCAYYSIDPWSLASDMRCILLLYGIYNRTRLSTSGNNDFRSCVNL